MTLLITPEYREANKQLHNDIPEYGTSSKRWGKAVAAIANTFEAKYILDYGCGKGELKWALENSPFVKEYDPCIEGKDQTPDPQDMVVCTDVLEHIEPELIDNVLDDLKRVTKKVGFFVIDTAPAIKTLPDGRNAHLIQEGVDWWLPKLMSRFQLLNMDATSREIVVVVKPK
jgi:2-polyprenyl-3-methyl-5-hydroxy-6-metoxy-1,4-benzoquinol methylase